MGEMLGATNLPITFSDDKHAMTQYELELVFDQLVAYLKVLPSWTVFCV